MKIRSFKLTLGSLFLLPASVMAAMTPMMNSELADVMGQAYVVQFAGVQKAVPDLTQRDIPVVSDKARAMERGYPQATNIARQVVVAGMNTALVQGKTVAGMGAATVPGVGPFLSPVIMMLPNPTVSFK